MPGVVHHDIEVAGLVDHGARRGVGGVLGLHVELDDAQVEVLVPSKVEQPLGVDGPTTGGVAHAGVDRVPGGRQGAGRGVADFEGIVSRQAGPAPPLLPPVRDGSEKRRHGVGAGGEAGFPAPPSSRWPLKED